MTILSKKRVKALDEFREQATKAVSEMIEKEKNPIIREAFEQTLKNISFLQLEFFPTKALASNLKRIGNFLMGSVVKGQQVNKIIIVSQGLKKRIIIESKIQLPAEHIFSGDKLSLSGVHTLMHEYCHFPRNVQRFANALGLSETQAEELIADLLSAKISLKLGIDKGTVYSFYSGRDFVFYPFPFRKALHKTVYGK